MSMPTSTNNQQARQSSPISSQLRPLSRTNSNTSTATSSSINKCELSSTISTTNSVASSSRSQLSRPQLIDHRQLFATCGGSSTPIRSFQRATISSVVKTRAFDNNPVLQGLLTSASQSGQNSVSNSQTPSPISTPVFSRSRSLRMSGGPRRYQASPSHHSRASSRTPDLYSFSNAGDTSLYNPSNSASHTRIAELNSEKSELKESLEFLECERQVLIDSTRELKEILSRERAQWKRESDELKRQLTDSMAGRIKAESQLTKIDLESNDYRLQSKKFTEELQNKDRLIASLKDELEFTQRQLSDLTAINNELKLALTGKNESNGSNSAQNVDANDHVSIISDLARLRLEMNEKNLLIDELTGRVKKHADSTSHSNYDIETLNKILDQAVECIKSWPEELASSSHVQNLMKTLVSAYRPPDQDELSSRLNSMRL